MAAEFGRVVRLDGVRAPEFALLALLQVACEVGDDILVGLILRRLQPGIRLRAASMDDLHTHGNGWRDLAGRLLLEGGRKEPDARTWLLLRSPTWKSGVIAYLAGIPGGLPDAVAGLRDLQRRFGEVPSAHAFIETFGAFGKEQELSTELDACLDELVSHVADLWGSYLDMYEAMYDGGGNEEAAENGAGDGE